MPIDWRTCDVCEGTRFDECNRLCPECGGDGCLPPKNLGNPIDEGSVVQINERGQNALVGCFAIVLESFSWGVIAYIPVPSSDCLKVRLNRNQYIPIGETKLESRKQKGLK